MTPQEPAITTAPQYRFAGWAAITSGMIGFFAYAALMTGVFSRLSGGEERFWTLLFRSHDAGAILQALLMIPVVLTLHHVATQKSTGVGRATVVAGVIALSLMILLMLLGFAGRHRRYDLHGSARRARSVAHCCRPTRAGSCSPRPQVAGIRVRDRPRVRCHLSDRLCRSG